MKKFALIVNFGFLIFAVYENVKFGVGSNLSDVLMSLLFLSEPVINIIALHSLKEDDWLSLFFQRKALEEQNKIAALKEKLNK